MASAKMCAEAAEFWPSHSPGVAAAFTVAEAAANGGQPNVAANKSANL